jgi:4-amino-4-deoxy-L-arabinose transferase-like glycosyltransferase
VSGARATERGEAEHGHATIPSFAFREVLAIAGGTVALLLVVATRYGYHRDELYFLEASRHMAWGYVDQPPLSIALIWVSRTLFGDSLLALRVLPAIAAGGVVVFAGLLAREFGGERFAQAFGALVVGLSPLPLVAGHLAGPTIYDLLAWAAVSWLVVRILRTGRDRLWLVVGVVVGLALLNKETILLLLGGLVLGLLLDRRWEVFRSPWLWMGALVAVVMWSPNLVWEGANAWPTVEMSRNLQADHSGLGVSLTFPVIQLLMPGLWAAPIWMAGLWAMWREPRFRPYRAFATAYPILFALVGIVIGDRPYYLGGLYFVLLAAGTVVTEEVVAGARRFFSAKAARRRLVWRSASSAVAFVAIAGVIGVPVALPVLPATALATVPLQNVNYNLGEMIGWSLMVRQIARAYRSVPEAERAHTVILTSNYGEAGAIDRYGPRLGLPRAYSGHNSYWWWGRPPDGTTTVVAVGFDRRYLQEFFRSVLPTGSLHNGAGVDDDEEGALLSICRGPRAPWVALWPRLRHYG